MNYAQTTRAKKDGILNINLITYCSSFLFLKFAAVTIRWGEDERGKNSHSYMFSFNYA